MKSSVGWRNTLRSVLEQRKDFSESMEKSLQRFFEQAFSHAQEPSASWFGFHQHRVSLVIGNYYLAALRGKKIWILVDSKAHVSGFKSVPTGRGNLKWLFSSDFRLVKNLLENQPLWASYARASREALNCPDGRPRKDSFYIKHGKERLSDFWPETHRGNLLQELDFAEPGLKMLLTTEAEAIRLSRIGQGRFRDSLLGRGAQCAVTGCKATRVLRASHIKPWAVSTNGERLDPYNGILLIPNLDAAFDTGLITFEDDGKIRISSQLCAEDVRLLGIDQNMRVSTFNKRHMKYLRYHRQQVFKQ